MSLAFIIVVSAFTHEQQVRERNHNVSLDSWLPLCGPGVEKGKA